MKIIIDANLPFKLAGILKRKGFDVVHTDDLIHKERTSDIEILQISTRDDRIVITKDLDFLDTYIVKQIPKRLLLVSTGNIRNKDLFLLFEKYLDEITRMFETFNFIELHNNGLTGHE